MEPTLRILHLEDDPVDSQLALSLLREDRLPAQIDRVDTMARFTSALEQGNYRLVLCDYTIPGMNTLKVLELARRVRPEIPFIFLSGTLGEDHAIDTLKMGATDYVLKQRIQRLVPAVRRALQEAEESARRKQAEEDREVALHKLRQLNETLEQRVAERTAEAEKRAEQLRVMAAQLAGTEQRERRRLAQMLHDHLQQLLAAARLRIERLRRRIQDETLRPVVEEVDGLIKQSISESRAVTVELSPPVLYDGGLAAGLRWLARRMAEKYELAVDIQSDPTADPADENLRVFLFQAVRELLINVVKHARISRAAVTLSQSDDGELRIEVRDQGAGHDQAVLLRQIGTGGGFGLFAIRERVEVLGGRLEVESAPGRGTRVAMVVPPATRLPAAASPGAEAEAAGQQGGQRGGREKKTGGLRVLLADDHPIVRKGLADMLRGQAGIETVIEASDGQEAVELARANKPHMIVMDITMPRMNGIEATRCIRAELPDTQVIGLSMHEDEDMARAMLEAGATNYLRKDQAAEALVTTLFQSVHMQSAANAKQ